jgi:hypothetical protein
MLFSTDFNFTECFAVILLNVNLLNVTHLDAILLTVIFGLLNAILLIVVLSSVTQWNVVLQNFVQ